MNNITGCRVAQWLALLPHSKKVPGGGPETEHPTVWSLHVLPVHVWVLSGISDTCKTFGSGVFQNFNGSAYYMRSSCRYYLTRFTHDNFECSIIVQRDKDSLLMSRVEILINGLITVLEAKSITVKSERFDI
uniref:VWFD domain-containing protein n=1 Tax=Oryzias sinensis TaxID=183150 RepID=A0A8C7WLR0_9TELE